MPTHSAMVLAMILPVILPMILPMILPSCPVRAEQQGRGLADAPALEPRTGPDADRNR